MGCDGPLSEQRQHGGEVGGQALAESLRLGDLASPEVVEEGAAPVGQEAPECQPTVHSKEGSKHVAGVVLLGGHAVGHECSAGCEELERTLEAWAAEVVEYGVDACGCELSDAVGQLRVVVVDGFGTHLCQGVVVACRGGADDSDAGVACQLDERVSYAALAQM